MKLKLLAALLATTSVAAMAQSSVTIRGAIELGVIKKTGASAKLDATNGMNTLDFLGTEDLGGGLKANFLLGARFSPESGGTDGTKNQRPLFNGESTVGLSGGFGAVKIGRALTAVQTFANLADPFGTRTEGAVNNAVTGYAVDFDTLAKDGNGLARTDGIFYTSPKLGGLTVTASLGLKNSTAPADNAAAANAANTKQLVSLWLDYNIGALKLGGGYERTRVNDKVSVLLATYDFGSFRLGGSYSVTDTQGIIPYALAPATPLAASGSKRKAWVIGATVPMGAFTLKAGFNGTKAETTGLKTNKVGVGLDYALSKRTFVYTSLGRTNNRDKADVTGYDVGIRHTF